MRNILFLTLILMAPIFASTVSAQGTVVVSDSFNDDTVGQSPGVPDVGTSAYFGSGTHTIIDDYGSQSLRNTDASTSDGYAIQWFPTSNPSVFEITYLYRIESTTSTSGNILAQHINVATPGSVGQVSLYWSHGGQLYFVSGTTSFIWTHSTTYRVRVQLNCNTDTASLWIDGADVAFGMALGYSCENLLSFAVSSSIEDTSSVSIDELKIVEGELIFGDGFESGDASKWSEVETPPLAPGDSCNNPIPLGTGSITSTLSDNTASGLTDSCGTGNTVDEWVSYTAPCSGTVSVTTCHPSTDFDTIVSAWSGSECSSIAEVACNDDALGAPVECELGGLNRKSLATFSTSAGATYLFRVSAFNNGNGIYQLSSSCVP